MADAGPSRQPKSKRKKTGSVNGIRSSKVKKVGEVKSIEALEEAATNYVSRSVTGVMCFGSSLTQHL